MLHREERVSKRDYYEVLGLQRDASPDQIKKAYRKLAIEFHPDKNPGNVEAEEKFKEATEAYQVLSNDESRAKYDRFGHSAFQGGQGFGDFNMFAEDIFGDIFGAFFGTGGGGRSTRTPKGRDLQYRLDISLEESALGLQKTITIRRPVPCETCTGSGCRPGTSPEKCKHCGGQGQMSSQEGFFRISRPCPVCRGEGRMISDPCAGCGGSGEGFKNSELLVKVPAGIDSGQKLKLRGEGELIKDGVAGDLYVDINITPHKKFKRQGTEIVSEIPLSYTQAALGAELEIPTLYGKAKMKISAGTQSGKVFRLKGQGIVDLQSGVKGDQHVRVFVVVPKKVTDRQKELLEELAKIEGVPNVDEYTQGRSFFDKVKEFFD
jgi:molecular chaperone DnaJ